MIRENKILEEQLVSIVFFEKFYSSLSGLEIYSTDYKNMIFLYNKGDSMAAVR